MFIIKVGIVMQKYGFYGGSFNPVTNAHINIALNIVKKCGLDKIVFVPVGNNYNKKDLADEKHRYNMLKIATQPYKELEVSDLEMNLDRNLDAIDVFKMIEDKYPNIIIYYIMGADNLSKMLLWKDFNNLVKNYKYIIIERDLLDCKQLIKSNDILTKYRTNFDILENNYYSKISATEVRKKIQSRNLDNIDNYISENIMKYISDNNLYN